MIEQFWIRQKCATIPTWPNLHFLTCLTKTKHTITTNYQPTTCFESRTKAFCARKGDQKCTWPTASTIPRVLRCSDILPRKDGCVTRITPATQTGMATYTALQNQVTQSIQQTCMCICKIREERQAAAYKSTWPAYMVLI